MKEKNKIAIKNSVDVIVSRIPILGVTFDLCKAYFGAGMKLRKDRVLEWVEMVKDNPSKLTGEILSDRNFQDGFVYALEKYIREKNENKRKIMRNIFLGFAENNRKENFEIERMYYVLSILNNDDLRLLRNVDENKKEFHQVFPDITDQEDINENTYNLISAGILISDYSSRLGPVRAPFIKITRFGKDFIDYLEK